MRIRRFALLMLSVAATSVPFSAVALGAETEVAPMRFVSSLDLEGKIHRIGNGEGYQAVALVFLTTECPISREVVPELNRLAQSFADKPVKFVGVIYQPGLTRAEAVQFQQEFKIKFPLLFDGSGELAEILAPTHVPEAFVLNREATVVYRGRVDDQYAAVGRKRPEPTTHDLADAVSAVLTGQEPKSARTPAVGCPIEAKRTADAKSITYTRDIAPILYANCVECHRPGEVAPFSLVNYEDAAKRATFLAEVTRGKSMPPWMAEIGHGHFLGERRLTERQIALIETWASQEAPEGDKADLPPVPRFPSGWRLGKPDLELTAPAPFNVPAGGGDIFQHFVIPLDLDEDKTIVGYEFHPGNASVVHHAILFLDNSGMARRKDEETPEPGYTTFGSIGVPVSGIVGVWTPGMTPRFYPNNAGMAVRKGTELVLQLHIHPSGKETTDQSSVALYFADKPVERKMARAPFVVGSIMIDIAAGAKEHTIQSSITLPTDVTLISLLPHMHLIGKEMKVTATLPDGSEQGIIWIKDWNFFWQDNYVFHDPLRLPKGTRIDLTSRYDNTEDNPLNPSKPPQRVMFGNGSADEMCFGIFQLIVDNPREEGRLQGALMQSMMRDWSTAKIDPEARARIADEAGKLFGGGGGAFRSLLGGE